MARPEYRANPANRCYYCKHELYTHLSAIARERGIPVIADGSNADDRGDYRPGRQAAREFGVRSPLDEAGPDEKRNPRALAARRAADLGRAGVGVPLVAHPVFQRSHRREAADDRARGKRACAIWASASAASVITTPSRGSSLDATRSRGRWSRRPAEAIDRELRAIGYAHVTVDLRGYRLGSLNEALRLREV